MFDRRPNRLGYGVIVASGAAVAYGVAALLESLAPATRFFWGLLVPALVFLDGSLEFLFGVRLEYYLVLALVLAAAFLAFLVLVLPGTTRSTRDDPEGSPLPRDSDEDPVARNPREAPLPLHF